MRPVPGFSDHFSRGADAYSRARPTYPDALARWLATLVPESAPRVWDCGTGSGQAAVALAPHIGHVIATDASVAQLRHAMRHPTVHYAEVRRVCAPAAAIAAWTYGRVTVDPTIDSLVNELYFETLAPWWAPERRHADDGYATLAFPFARISSPDDVVMEVRWTADALLAYLETWSAVTAMRAAGAGDPVQAIAEAVRAAWGPGARAVRWPLTVLAGRANG